MRKIKSGVNKIKSGAVKQTVPPNIQNAFLQQVENKRIETTINNLGVAQAKGVVEGLIKAFEEIFPKINFHCIPKYNKYIKYIKTYSKQFVDAVEKRNIDFSKRLIAVESWKLYDIEEKLSKSKSGTTKTTKDIGIYNSTLQFFEFIDNTYEIINKLLVIHPFYSSNEMKLLKYIRTYLLKLSVFFITEVESDLKNRGVSA